MLIVTLLQNWLAGISSFVTSVLGDSVISAEPLLFISNMARSGLNPKSVQSHFKNDVMHVVPNTMQVPKGPKEVLSHCRAAGLVAKRLSTVIRSSAQQLSLLIAAWQELLGLLGLDVITVAEVFRIPIGLVG